MFDLLAPAAAAMRANPMLLGGLSAGAAGGMVMQLRAAPKNIFKATRDQVMSSLTLYESDSAFDIIAMWLAQHPSVKRTRNMAMAQQWDSETGKSKFAITIGEGLHLIVDEGRPFWLTKSISEAKGGYSNRLITLTISTLGRSTAPLQKLLGKALAYRDGSDLVAVHVWRGEAYKLADRKPARPLSSVNLPAAQKADIVRDLDAFLAGQTWYRERCLNWRRGYAFTGPPGTGKTTLILALAAHARKPVYIINLNAVEDDNVLIDAVAQARDGFVVFEDMDAQNMPAKREELDEPDDEPAKPMELKPYAGGPLTPVPPKPQGKSKVTLSGVLNAVDGITSREGRVLCMTANCPERLDAALLRPGRVDRRYELGLADEEVAREMFARFFPDEDPALFCAELELQGAFPISPAALQEMLLERAVARAPK